MLSEIPEVRQIPGEGTRRWFADGEFDLIVWYRDGEILGFQLCYDRLGRPRAFTWTATDGRAHHAIDDGEDTPSGGKASPILVADGVFDAARVRPRFAAAAEKLPAEIRVLVLERLG